MRLMPDYQHNLEQQEQAQHDILQLKEHEIHLLIEQKEQEIAERKNVINQYRQVINQEVSLDGRFLNTNEYVRFAISVHILVKKPQKQIGIVYGQWLTNIYHIFIES